MNFTKKNQLTGLIFIFLFTVLLWSSCTANKNSYITKSEKVYLKIEHKSEDRDIKNISSIVPGKTNGQSKSRGLAFALPYIFKLSVTEAVKILDKEKAKYIANYNAKVTDDLFYKNTEKDADINIKNIKIIRTVEYGNIKKDTAFVLTLGIEQSNDGYFLRFATKNIDIRRTKAKLKTTDNNVDFNLKLSLSAFWFDGNKQHNSKEIANVSILYLDIPLNTKTDKTELKKYKTQWFPVVPRTAFSNNEFGTGNYMIKANITEYDNFSKRTEIDTDNEHIKKQGDVIKGFLEELKNR